MLTRILTCTLLAASTLAAAGNYEERQIQSFEAGPNGWSGGQVVQSEQAVNGIHVYRAEFARPGDTIEWTGSLDFSGWSKLKLDTINEGEPFTVSMIFQDADGRSYRSWYQLITRGRGHLEYNLRGLSSAVPEADGSINSLDITRITSMRLMVDSIPGPLHVSIDNVRLSRGEEPPVPLELFRPETEAAPVEEVPGNLIRNGSFELSMAHWHTWGMWDGGEYRFGTISGADAHSGAIAATITAHEVGRGGIFHYFDVPAAGRYRLRFAYRGDGADRMRVLVGPEDQLENTFAVTEQWQLFEHELDLPQGPHHLYLFHVSAGTLLLDTVSLAPVDQEAAQRLEEEAAPLAGEANRVEIRGNQVFVNGEAFFPIGFWTVNDIADLEGAGTNLNFWLDLDLAAQAEVLTTVDFTQVLRGHRPDLAVELARPHVNHPALFGWYLCDEPDHARWTVPPHMVRAAHQALKRWDDRLPTMAILMSWHRSMAYQYADSADILISLAYTNEDTELVVRATRWLVDRSAEPRPSWLGLRSSSGEHTLPVPTLENARVQAYAAIANGATGLFWFELDWPARHYPELLRDNIFSLTSELNSIHDVLASADSPEQPTSDNPNVHLRMKDGPEGPVVIAVNVTGEDLGEVRITLPQGVRADSATVAFEDRQVKLRDGAVVVDTFGPKQRHVYRIEQ